MKHLAQPHLSFCVPRRPESSGFTLIELLVAMFVMVIIVLITGMIFQRASVVWDTGMNKVQLDMTGRGVADYVAKELSTAIPSNFPAISTGASSVNFLVLTDTNPAVLLVQYNYGAGTLTRSGTVIVEGLKDLKFKPSTAVVDGIPLYVDVVVTVTNETVGVESLYQSRAYFINRSRYKL